jgi:hypothetical protein
MLKQEMLQQEILKRDLPPLLTMNDWRPCTKELWRERRAEILDILQKNIYGYTPEPPEKVTGKQSLCTIIFTYCIPTRYTGHIQPYRRNNRQSCFLILMLLKEKRNKFFC